MLIQKNDRVDQNRSRNRRRLEKGEKNPAKSGGCKMVDEKWDYYKRMSEVY